MGERQQGSLFSLHKLEIETQTDSMICQNKPMAELARGSFFDLPLP